MVCDKVLCVCEQVVCEQVGCDNVVCVCDDVVCERWRVREGV